MSKLRSSFGVMKETLPKALRTQALTTWFGLVWFGRFGLIGLVWQVWFGRFGLVGLVW